MHQAGGNGIPDHLFLFRLQSNRHPRAASSVQLSQNPGLTVVDAVARGSSYSAV
jgi:hypothetical protein